MAKKKTIACDRCGARLDHIPEKCPECGEVIYDRMDPHIRKRIHEKMKKRQFARPVFICVGVAVLLIIVCYVIIPLFISPNKFPEANAMGTLSAARSAQDIYQQKYKTYGTFGDLYNAGFLQESTFNVGYGSAYKYGYKVIITVTSSAQWDCVGVPDDPNERYLMVDETGTFSASEDYGATWTSYRYGP